MLTGALGQSVETHAERFSRFEFFVTGAAWRIVPENPSRRAWTWRSSRWSSRAQAKET